MRTAIALTSVLWAMCASGPSGAESRVELLYRDELHPSAPISRTSTVVGIVREPYPVTAEAVSLWVEAPADWAGAPVCVWTRSADALYTGTGAATLAGAGVTELVIDPDRLRASGGHPDVLAEEAIQGGLAVLVQAGACGERPDVSAGTAVARWSADAADATVLVYVNSSNADRVIAKIEGRDGRLLPPMPCARTVGDVGVAYDHVCRLDIPATTADGSATLVIDRFRDGNPDERPARMTLALPAAP